MSRHYFTDSDYYYYYYYGASSHDYDSGGIRFYRRTLKSTDERSSVPGGEYDDPTAEQESELVVTVEDASGTEGETLVFRILLSRALTEEMKVSWSTSPAYHLLDDRAHMSDYQTASGVMVFAPGVTALTGEVWLEQDGYDESDEYFAVEVYLPGGSYLADAVGTMTIADALDHPPR